QQRLLQRRVQGSTGLERFGQARGVGSGSAGSLDLDAGESDDERELAYALVELCLRFVESWHLLGSALDLVGNALPPLGFLEGFVGGRDQRLEVALDGFVSLLARRKRLARVENRRGSEWLERELCAEICQPQLLHLLDACATLGAVHEPHFVGLLAG